MSIENPKQFVVGQFTLFCDVKDDQITYELQANGVASTGPNIPAALRAFAIVTEESGPSASDPMREVLNCPDKSKQLSADEPVYVGPIDSSEPCPEPEGGRSLEATVLTSEEVYALFHRAALRDFERVMLSRLPTAADMVPDMVAFVASAMRMMLADRAQSAKATIPPTYLVGLALLNKLGLAASEHVLHYGESVLDQADMMIPLPATEGPKGMQ